MRDLELLVRHRRRMWAEMGVERGLDEADRAYRAWARRRLRTGELVAWVVEERGEPAASGAAWLMVVHPRPGLAGGPQPYLLSFFTEPGHRGKGHAARIVREAVRWARREGYPRLTLHASSMGRPVYARLGFERTWEMKLDLAPSPLQGVRARPRARRRAKPS